jgi:hypothetical protein
MGLALPKLPERDRDIPIDHGRRNESDFFSLELCLQHITDGNPRFLAHLSGKGNLKLLFDFDECHLKPSGLRIR